MPVGSTRPYVRRLEGRPPDLNALLFIRVCDFCPRSSSPCRRHSRFGAKFALLELTFPRNMKPMFVTAPKLAASTCLGSQSLQDDAWLSTAAARCRLRGSTARAIPTDPVGPSLRSSDPVSWRRLFHPQRTRLFALAPPGPYDELLSAELPGRARGRWGCDPQEHGASIGVTAAFITGRPSADYARLLSHSKSPPTIITFLSSCGTLGIWTGSTLRQRMPAPDFYQRMWDNHDVPSLLVGDGAPLPLQESGRFQTADAIAGDVARSAALRHCAGHELFSREDGWTECASIPSSGLTMPEGVPCWHTRASSWRGTVWGTFRRGVAPHRARSHTRRYGS